MNVRTAISVQTASHVLACYQMGNHAMAKVFVMEMPHIPAPVFVLAKKAGQDRDAHIVRQATLVPIAKLALGKYTHFLPHVMPTAFV